MSVLTEALSTTKLEFANDLRETAVEVTKAYELAISRVKTDLTESQEVAFE